MRLFAAVDPPAGVRQELLAAMPGRDELLRYVPPEQWHITLAFYGDVDEGKVGALQAGLDRAASRSRALRLRLAGAGTFPRQPAKARVLWVGLDGDVDQLRRVADRCAGAGRRARLAMEARAFRPHLTLARSRHGAVDATQAATGLEGFTSGWWTAGEIQLVRSHLGAHVRHEVMATYGLGAADSPGAVSHQA